MESIALKAMDPREYLRLQLSEGRRIDGRGFHDQRSLSITCNNIKPNLRIVGSAVVALGWTKVVAAVIADEVSLSAADLDDRIGARVDEFIDIIHLILNLQPSR